jgi:protein-S-isoprenylcysteine O-methyltransferase Ste14
LAGLALALYAAFLLVAFGWRSWTRYRETGDTGYRGFSGDTGWLERTAGMLFVISTSVCIANPVLVLLGYLAAPGQTGSPVISLTGIVLVVAGATLALAAQEYMGDAWRIGVGPGERLPLVRSGPFGYVRNPFFTGYLVATGGLVIAAPTAVGALGWILQILAVELQVRHVEEPYLRRELGSDYAEYAHSVGRFVPRLGRIRRA